MEHVDDEGIILEREMFQVALKVFGLIYNHYHDPSVVDHDRVLRSHNEVGEMFDKLQAKADTEEQQVHIPMALKEVRMFDDLIFFAESTLPILTPEKIDQQGLPGLNREESLTLEELADIEFDPFDPLGANDLNS